jgi:hypothetical protein
MLRMIGALRSRNKWDEEPSGGGLLIAILPIRQAFQCPTQRVSQLRLRNPKLPDLWR